MENPKKEKPQEPIDPKQNHYIEKEYKRLVGNNLELVFVSQTATTDLLLTLTHSLLHSQLYLNITLHNNDDKL